MPRIGYALILALQFLLAASAFGQRQAVTVEGVAVAKGQPLVFAKRVAWMDAMRTLAEQVIGVEFVLDTGRESALKYTVKGDVAPAGTVRQVSAETLPTGIYRITLNVEIEPDTPMMEALPEMIAEGQGDIAASRSLAAARTAAKATAMAQAIKKAALAEYAKSQQPIPRTLEGHAYYLGPVSERIEGNFYFMTARFKVKLRM